MQDEISEQSIKPPRVIDKQRVTGIFEEFDARGRNGGNNWVGGHDLQLCLAHHENGPVDLSEGGPPVRTADGTDAGRDSAVRGHLERSCHHALDVLFGLGLLVHAAHELLREFAAVCLDLFVHSDHGSDELRVLLVPGKPVYEDVATDAAPAKLFGIGQQLRDPERPAYKDDVIQLKMFEEFLDVLRAALARVALRGLVRVALRPGVEGHDMKVLGKVLELRLPDPRRHAPAWFEKDGRPAAGFEIVQLDSIRGFERAVLALCTHNERGWYQQKRQQEKKFTQHEAPHSSAP